MDDSDAVGLACANWAQHRSHAKVARSMEVKVLNLQVKKPIHSGWASYPPVGVLATAPPSQWVIDLTVRCTEVFGCLPARRARRRLVMSHVGKDEIKVGL